MARTGYIETICSIASDGTLKAISNVRVTVTRHGTSTPATIYADAAGTPKSYQFVTGADGLAEFYADFGEYDITFHDLNGTPRIGDKTIYWQSNPVDQGFVGFDMGDLKTSSKKVDHGRWLRMDGRELSQTQVEAALGLTAGDAAAFVTYMGTGSGSMYGAAAASKVKLPNTLRRIPVYEGGSGDTGGDSNASGLTARSLGALAGAETVTLTASQSGLPAHGHSVTDPGHAHSASSDSKTPVITASQSAHTHGVSGSTSTDPGHAHGLTQKSVGAASPFTFATNGGGTDNNTSAAGAHSHSFSVTSGSSQPAITATQAAHSHAITVVSTTTGISVQNNAGAGANSSHENMPPFVVVGSLFIRV